MQVVALDFGPVGEADVTANLMEYAPCGPVRHELAEVPHAPDALPFLRIKAAHHGATSNVLAQVLSESCPQQTGGMPVLSSYPRCAMHESCRSVCRCSNACSHVCFAHVVHACMLCCMYTMSTSHHVSRGC